MYILIIFTYKLRSELMYVGKHCVMNSASKTGCTVEVVTNSHLSVISVWIINEIVGQCPVKTCSFMMLPIY
jgi:hypothetical protein